mmetsp:Transcript_24860/g.62144  ORF Transcript_24860/g.62144 Transcript_24860/m.62144 type:complete len:244 (+) Transcript_24860:129-860(+)
MRAGPRAARGGRQKRDGVFVKRGDDLEFGLDGGLLRDVDAVEELADVLLLNETRLVDEGRGAGDEVDVVAFDDELVFDVVGAEAGDVAEHVDAAGAFLAEEVADLAELVVIGAGDIDGEMRVDEAELVAEAEGDPLDAVVDHGAEGVEGRALLGEGEPAIDADGVANGDFEAVFGCFARAVVVVDGVDLDAEVRGVADEGAAGAGDAKLPGLDLDLDAVGDGDELGGEDEFHGDGEEWGKREA